MGKSEAKAKAATAATQNKIKEVEKSEAVYLEGTCS